MGGPGLTQLQQALVLLLGLDLSLGEEFLSYVKDDMTITVKDDGVVVVE